MRFHLSVLEKKICEPKAKTFSKKNPQKYDKYQTQFINDQPNGSSKQPSKIFSLMKWY